MTCTVLPLYFPDRKATMWPIGWKTSGTTRVTGKKWPQELRSKQNSKDATISSELFYAVSSVKFINRDRDG